MTISFTHDTMRDSHSSHCF